MNVIFLDVDGVLNSINKLIETYKKTNKPHSGNDYPFDELCLKNLSKLLEATNYKIVISSTWRKKLESMMILNNELEKYNILKYVIGKTPILDNREEEIKYYLKKHPEIKEYIILDDDYISEEMDKHLIKINNQFGLSETDIKKCLKRVK